MKNTQKGSTLVIILVVIVAILLAALGYMYAKLQQAPVIAVVESAPVSAPVPVAVPVAVPAAAPAPTPTDCGLRVTSVTPNTAIAFPVTISGTVNNATGCSPWSMFEGQAGTAQMYFNYNNEGWTKLGVSVPVKVSDWTAVSTQFSVALVFSNDSIGIPDGVPMKIVFAAEDASGLGNAGTTEFSFFYKNSVAAKPIATPDAPVTVTSAPSDEASAFDLMTSVLTKLGMSETGLVTMNISSSHGYGFIVTHSAAQNLKISKTLGATGAVDKLDIATRFTNELKSRGFVSDPEYDADGTTVGSEGYSKGTIVCVIQNKITTPLNQITETSGAATVDTVICVDTKKTASQPQSASGMTTYSGMSEYPGMSDGVQFTSFYPSSWVAYQFSCNADGVAFWPKSAAPDLSMGLSCGMDSALNTAPIIVNFTSEGPQFAPLKDSRYQSVYDQMKASIVF